jgi:uncharacterized protein
VDVERFRRLHAAFRSGDFDALRRELGEVDNFPNVDAGSGIGACLTYAIYHGPFSLVRDLLDAGADPNWPTDDGFPPLIAALSTGTRTPGATTRSDVHELLHLLLDHGADVAQRGVNDYTPLHWSAGQGDLDSVDILLAAGADPNEITRIDDYETPLEVATAAGRVAVVERLTPLTTRHTWQEASRSGNLTVLRRMLESGHNIDSTDGYGQTALMRAAHGGQHELVKWLVGRGANPNHKAKFNLTALMLAVVAGNHRIARTLIANGADTTITGTGAPGFHGKTAADLALERGDRRLAAFIANRLSK